MQLPRRPNQTRPLLLTDAGMGSFAVIADLYRRSLQALGQRPEEGPYPRTGDLSGLPPGRMLLHNARPFLFNPVEGSPNIALAVHEWSQIRRDWSDTLNRFDEVWITSDHVAAVFRRSGVSVPIHFVPPALDLEAIPRKEKYTTEGPFRFFYCGEPHFRKGHHLLIEGFLRAFPEPGEAVLTLKTSPGCDWQSPREDIAIVSERLSRQKLLGLYCTQDAFVSASLGEGLGLPLAESILAGLPVVTHPWGGHGSLLTDGAYWPIEYSVIPQPFCSRPEYYAPGQKCAFSEPTAIADSLRTVASASAELRAEKAEASRRGLLARYGAEAALPRLGAALERAAGPPVSPL